MITDPDFVTKPEECITILTPIDMYIELFESDALPCSDVYKAFLELKEKMYEYEYDNEEDVQLSD